MSDCKAAYRDFTHSMRDEVTVSGHLYEALNKSTLNPAYVHTTLDKTATESRNPEGLLPNEQPGSVSSCYVEAFEDRKKASAQPLKNGVISPTYLITLFIAVVLIAAGIAIIVTFGEISKLHSEVAVLQSTSPKQAVSIQALENSIDMRLSDQFNNSELNDELNFKNISISISSQ